MSRNLSKSARLASIALGATTLTAFLAMTPAQAFAATDSSSHSSHSSGLDKGQGFGSRFPGQFFDHAHKNVIVSSTLTKTAGTSYTSNNYVKPNAPVVFNLKQTPQVLHALGLQYKDGSLVQPGADHHGFLGVLGDKGHGNDKGQGNDQGHVFGKGSGFTKPAHDTVGVLLVNGSSYKLATKSNGLLSYSADGSKITIKSTFPTFSRYTKYSTYLLTGSELNKAQSMLKLTSNHNLSKFEKGLQHFIGKFDPHASSPSQNANTLLAKEASEGLIDGFSFETGSAIGEATNVHIHVVSPSVSVTAGGSLVVNATDDYGDPATGATVTISGSGSGNGSVKSDFSAPTTTSLTNGSATIPLTDHSAETVSLKVTVKDTTYTGANDSHSTTLPEIFTPGGVSKITVTNPSSITAGKDASFTANAVDKYGNPVADGSKIGLKASSGAISNVTSTSSGQFSFSLDTTKAGTDTVTLSGSNSGYSVTDNVSVSSGTPSKAVITLPKLTSGSSATVSGTVTDQYGNPVPNATITLSGSLTGTLTTDASGNYSGSVKVGSSGAVSASSGSSPITLSDSSGTSITSVTTASSSSSGGVGNLVGTWKQVTKPTASTFISDPYTGGFFSYGGSSSGDILKLYNSSKQLIKTLYTGTKTGLPPVSISIDPNNGNIAIATFGVDTWVSGDPRGVYMYNQSKGTIQVIQGITNDPEGQGQTRGLAFDPSTGDIYFSQDSWDYASNSYKTNLYKWSNSTGKVSIVAPNVSGRVVYDGKTKQIIVINAVVSNGKIVDLIDKFSLNNNLSESKYILPNSAPFHTILGFADYTVGPNGDLWFFDNSRIWKYNPLTDQAYINKDLSTTGFFYSSSPTYNRKILVTPSGSLIVEPSSAPTKAFEFTPQ